MFTLLIVAYIVELLKHSEFSRVNKSPKKKYLEESFKYQPEMLMGIV